MKSLPNLNKLVLTATFLTALTGCSSGPAVQEYPATANPAAEVASLENDIIAAQNKQVNFLAPENFEEANDSLEDAKKMLSKGEDADDTLHEVAVGRAYLNNAKSAAQRVGRVLSDVAEARQAAYSAGAVSYFPKEMTKVDQEYGDLIKYAEKEKTSKVAKQRPEVHKKYLDLELKAIKEKNLAESRNIIDMAKKEHAKKFAPKTLSEAEKKFAETEAYISANRHNSAAIGVRSAQTVAAANHALNINRISKKQKDLPPEELALMLENERMRVASRENQLESVKDELQSTQSALDREKSVAASLESSKEYLEAQKKLNEKYEIARKQFSADEAEVYKQGDALLIRLKGMEFPSSKATITDKSKPLLEKVSRVVGDFGASKVVIEGHTDSIGGKQINDRLSQNRAAAVKEYLQSNEGAFATNVTEIEAVGYGYKKPLATNKTADGRAQNRRVDIIIKPDNSKL